ncbi:MAG: formate/nitrite transporter family protein, partial [Sneathia sanguinegens]
MKTISELLEYVIEAGKHREEKNLLQLAILAILSGIFIALGAVGNIFVSSDIFFTNINLAKFLGACVFPVGLIAIILLKFELFTSNCMMTIAVIEKKMKLSKMFKILFIVWIFNLVGGVIIAFITYKTGTFNENSIKVLQVYAHHKVTTGAVDMILKGVMCNILVCTASLLGYIAKDGISKIFGIWFPIMLFILLGYSHVVANMLYLP